MIMLTLNEITTTMTMKTSKGTPRTFFSIQKRKYERQQQQQCCTIFLMCYVYFLMFSCRDDHETNRNRFRNLQQQQQGVHALSFNRYNLRPAIRYSNDDSFNYLNSIDRQQQQQKQQDVQNTNLPPNNNSNDSYDNDMYSRWKQNRNIRDETTTSTTTNDNMPPTWQQQQQKAQEARMAAAQAATTPMIISARCVCGSFHIEFPASAVTSSSSILPSTGTTTTTTGSGWTDTTSPPSTTCAVDCHCPQCRKYHVAAFASYIEIAKKYVTIKHENEYNENDNQNDGYRNNGDGIYYDTCSGGMGVPGGAPIAMKRIYCQHCSSKMYSEPILPHQNTYNKNYYREKWSSSTSSNNGNDKDTDSDDNTMLLLNMGNLLDHTIPYHLMNQWKQQTPNVQPLAASRDSMEERRILSQYGRKQWKVVDTAAWTWSRPRYPENPDNNNDNYENENVYYNSNGEESTTNGMVRPTNHRLHHDDDLDDDENIVSFRTHANFVRKPLVLKGGCTCGKCQYTIDFQSPSELQHCYCSICRKVSGSAFMTWIPVPSIDFQWTALPRKPDGTDPIVPTNPLTGDADHILKRYTDHGRRHVCTKCHSVLTIIYDGDHGEIIWPAAATIDTIHLPSKYQLMNQYLNRVVHICVNGKQSWYDVPNDGLERYNDAS